MSTENEANVDSSDAITLEEAGPDSTSGTFEVAEGSKVKKPLYATPVNKEEQMREAQERIEADARAGFDKMVYTDEDSSIRQTLFVVLDEPDSGLVARLISVVMMLLILWSSTSLVIETVKEVKEKTELVTLLHIMEVIAVLVFTLEYLVRMACCTDRPGESKGFFSYLFAPMNLIDLMSVLPFYIELMVGKNGSGFEVLRLLRMARVFRCADPPHLSTRLSSQLPHRPAPRRCRLEHNEVPGARDLLRHRGAVVVHSTITIIIVCERQCSSFVQCFDHTLELCI